MFQSKGSLLGVLGFAIEKTEINLVPLPSSREEDLTKVFC